jgi:hypothetical protein
MPDQNDTQNVTPGQHKANQIAKAIGAPEPTQETDGWLTYCPVHEATHEGHSPSLMCFDKGNVYCRTGGAECKGQMAAALRALGIESRPTSPGWKVLREHYWPSRDGQWELRHTKWQTPDGDTPFPWYYRRKGSSDKFEKCGKYKGGDQSIFKVLPGARALMYGTENLEISDVILLVEGEKDVDSLTDIGLPAVTIGGASEKFDAQRAELLEGKTVAILPDNDDAGRKAAAVWATGLLQYARTVGIVELPGLEEKGDVSDWIEAGGTRDQLIEAMAAAEPITKPLVNESEVGSDWSEMLVRVERGQNKGNIQQGHRRNYLLIVRHEVPELAFNSRTSLPIWIEDDGTVVEDPDVVHGRTLDRVQQFIVADGRFDMRTMVHCARTLRPMDPVEQAVHALPVWDGTPRVRHLLERYMGASGDTEYLEAVSTQMMTGMAARVLEPGAKHDYMAILLGTEGLGKSEALRALALDEHYMTEESVDRIDAEFRRSLLTKLVVEIPEVGRLLKDKRTSEMFKGFISQRADNIRHLWRVNESVPRSWVAWGTTNARSEGFFEDTTSGRKFPVVGHPAGRGRDPRHV